MRTPPFFLAYCLLLLAGFALAKEVGLDAWPFAARTFASTSSGGGGSGGSSSYSSSGGGYYSGSSSHK